MKRYILPLLLIPAVAFAYNYERQISAERIRISTENYGPIAGSIFASGGGLAIDASPISFIFQGINVSNAGEITGILNPFDRPDGSAANVTYVDGPIKQNARAATTANITLSNQAESGDVIDGVTLALDDFLLVKNQTTQANNGLYRVKGSGTPDRVGSMNSAWSEVVGAMIKVNEGTVNTGSMWLSTSAATGTVGTTAITFRRNDVPSGLTSSGVVFYDGTKLVTDTSNLNFDNSTDVLTAQNVVVSSILTTQGAHYARVSTVSTNVTIDNTYEYIAGDATGGAITITFPECTTGTNGVIYALKKIDASGNAVNVARTGANDTFDGATSDSLLTQYANKTYVCISASDLWAVY